MIPHGWRSLAIAVLLLAAVPSCATAQSYDSIEEIRSEFVARATKGWDDFEVCEAFSNQDKRASLNRLLGGNLLATATTVDAREIFVRKAGAAAALHLGIAAVRYADEASATRVVQEIAGRESKYFVETKVATRYDAFRRADVVLLVYSETFLDEALRETFSQIEARRTGR